MHGACVKATGEPCQPGRPGQAAATRWWPSSRAAAASAPGSTTSASAAGGRRGSAAWPRPPASRPSAAPAQLLKRRPPAALRRARRSGRFSTAAARPAWSRAGRWAAPTTCSTRSRRGCTSSTRFLQSVIGLYDYAAHHRRRTSRGGCTRAAEPEARAEVPLPRHRRLVHLLLPRARVDAASTTSCCASSCRHVRPRTRARAYCDDRATASATTRSSRPSWTCSGPQRRPRARRPGALLPLQALGRPDHDHARRTARPRWTRLATFRRGEGSSPGSRGAAGIYTVAWRRRSCAPGRGLRTRVERRDRVAARRAEQGLRPAARVAAQYHPPDGASAHHPLHRQGRRRQDQRRRRHGAPLRRRRPAHGRALHRPGAQPVRLAGGASWAASRPQVGPNLFGPGGAGPGGDGAPLGGGVRMARASCSPTAAWTGSRPRS